MAARFRVLASILTLALGFFVWGAQSRAQDGLEPLTIVTATGTYAFQVEIAADPASRERGLMFRRYMRADRGMLFEFPTNEPVSFWMKDTYIALDMLFLAPDGTVTRVAENAEPMSETLIPSGGPCVGVLELDAGLVQRLGVKPGDKVKAAFFGG